MSSPIRILCLDCEWDEDYNGEACSKCGSGNLDFTTYNTYNKKLKRWQNTFDYEEWQKTKRSNNDC